MATNLVKSSSIATCELCSHFFSDPRMLPCLHSFCCKCLLKHFEGKKNDGYTCPTCDQAFVIPDGGIKALPKDLRGSYEADVAAYETKVKSESGVGCDRCIASSSESMAIKFCCDCCKFLCSQCTQDHIRWRETHKHELVDVGEEKEGQSERCLLDSVPHKKMKCQVHSDEVLKFYCETCSTLVCRDCIVLSHKEHLYNRIEEVADKEKSCLVSLLGDTDSATGKLEDAIARGEKVIQNIKMKQKFVDEEIDATFKDLHNALDSRKEFFLSKSSEIALGKITAINIQSEEMKNLYQEITRITTKIKEATQIYTPEEMLSAKGAMSAKLKDLMKQFSACSLDPCKNESMPTSFNSSIVKGEIEKFGLVAGGCYAPTSTAAIYIHQAIKGKVMKIIVTARDKQGKLYPYGGEVVRAKMGLLGAEEDYVFGEIKDNEDGKYEVSITPQSIGENQLKITLFNDDIKSSPFVISVQEERDYKTLVSSSSCLKDYPVSTQPWDVAFSGDDEMFVVEYGYHNVKVMNKTGETKHMISLMENGKSGKENGQFCYPSGIAIHGDMMYITEHGNNRVQKFTTSGEHLSTFASGDVSSPRGICIGPDGKIYVSEYNNHRISVFKADGTLDRRITENLNCPWGLAFDPSGNLHVANYSLNLVKVFDQDDNKINEYGKDIIQYPAGIAIDPEGYIFISEYYTSNSSYDYSRLFILNPQYQSVSSFQAFRYAVGVALDKDGYVYVCDQNQNRVRKF